MELSESFHETVFIFPESGLILGSLGVVPLTNIVHSAFLLGFVSACTAPLYLSLDSDFIAAAQVLIYVGAINVLLIFAVMLIKKGTEDSSAYRTVGDGITLVPCIGIFLLSDNTISNTSWSEVYLIARSNEDEGIVPMDNIRRIGSELVTEFFIPFELMSLILLIALVGAITLARARKTINSERKILRNEKNL
uniref:NADH dehydrogenase subunit 6 n=1 Tax=Aneura maxima TaxID=414042 RepID=UPI00279C8003|nr:NADH dehydrogenase subunit 6 [Aneura maxima]WGO59752.1 NADH dehydrogenase subunit 6 [Aneura maxima]WGO59838.1 NADH dehydrogenase subunit 6 [Aneura maxima]WGO59924.1 NADH dehydrogenase subunit 6 [Aneura maxima]WGO60010.1 NADH dehydrogenase subunit 6 [Aneura maxima]WGO60096.1 NADH dehydrogenase subunit 6 [Aneura maxima]